MPKSNDDEFFDTREDWSRRKHLILEHYLQPATAKLRRVSPDRRVIILDGFAGRGRYEDGTPGSPVHMGQLADKVRSWQDPVDLRILNIEADPDNHTELETCTKEWGAQGVITNYNTTFNNALQTALTEAASSPVFAFLDPFRPKHLSFADMAPLLTRRATTELLIVFHTPRVRRIIQQVRSPKTEDKTKFGSGKRLDAIFGSDRWKRFLDESPNDEAVVRCFIEELAVQCRLPRRSLFICDTPIEAQHGSDLKYHIIFVTRHLDGVRHINDAFANEKRDIHRRTLGDGTSSLFEEFADPMDAAQRPAGVRNLILEAVKQSPNVVWSFEDLMLRAMMLSFGQFTETDYKRTVRELLDSPTVPRLVGVSGSKLKSSKWKVEDALRLRLEA